MKKFAERARLIARFTACVFLPNRCSEDELLRRLNEARTAFGREPLHRQDS